MAISGKVLVADDHGPTLLGMRDLLEAAGHVVRTAQNGTEALRLAAAECPDVILLDVMMPGLSGTTVCRELKEAADTRLTPIVMISGSGDRGTRLAGLQAGADDFLNKPIDAEELRVRVASAIRMKRMTDELDSAESLFLTLGRIVEARDPYTVGHCERLAHYATALGAAMGLSASDLDALYRGAFLHDIGKIGIPDRVLLRKGKLSRRDYDLMKTHPVIGDSLCATLKSLEPVRPIVRHHHERLDGHGYPDALSGEQIPLLARIVSVVDVFDALTTDRPYRKALTVATAYKMLLTEARGGWCAESLIRQFIDVHAAGLPVASEEEARVDFGRSSRLTMEAG
ncbi:MAG TPA: HD domain-containing phosphohydrolase [Vicinamibacterales bacterium]|jgi:putative two-component system response regulator|nr:HD domain-containing phosphohydrolase [Vicinamibacterales bacterium]